MIIRAPDIMYSHFAVRNNIIVHRHTIIIMQETYRRKPFFFKYIRRSPILVTGIILTAIICGCTKVESNRTDFLNDRAYKYHYKNLDSTMKYAAKAYRMSAHYKVGKAEAMNNMVFVLMAKMQYQTAERILHEIHTVTNNEVELLISDIQHMRLCQRQSHNKDFYNYKEKVIKRLKRIKEEYNLLDNRQKHRILYAETEFHLVSSIYYYYIGLLNEASYELHQVKAETIQSDTALYLNYIYNMGTGSMIRGKSKKEIRQKEFDYLFKCYMISNKLGYIYWEANALQAISQHLNNDPYKYMSISENIDAIKYINVDNVPESMLSGNLAERSLKLFTLFGDIYQISGAYRTLGNNYWQILEYKPALACLQNALYRDTLINQAPDLVASICEQLCLVYSAMDNKALSDSCRNRYLDLQEQTRQDRQLEARAEILANSSRQLNILIVAIVILIVVILILLLLFDRLRRINDKKYSPEKILGPLMEWEKIYQEKIEGQNDELTELQEAARMAEIKLQGSTQKYIEQKAKATLAKSIIPFIDRIKNEAYKIHTAEETETVREERFEYICELTNKINEYNEVLTQWIRMRQGQLSIHIESFKLQELFDIVAKGKMRFELKQISLSVEPTPYVVKADKVLTLFMINTLLDNARKYTEINGNVQLYAEEKENLIEISIKDTGIGMSEEQQKHLFDHKELLIKKEIEGRPSHGFGLLNCKGIIDKYKKTSQIFEKCGITVKSKKGEGSIFRFSLPKGITRILITMLMLSAWSLKHGATITAQPISVTEKTDNTDRYLDKADGFADSLSIYNRRGMYEKALHYADSSIIMLNRYYHAKFPEHKIRMMTFSYTFITPAEIIWFRRGVKINYDIILDIRNESAIAALALHRWMLYDYNNNIYTQLFREMSADKNLESYCRAMQNSRTNKVIGMSILIFLLLFIFPAYYIVYYRHQIFYRSFIEKINAVNTIIMDDIPTQEKLKAVEKILKTVNAKGVKAEKRKELNQIIGKIKDIIQKSIDMQERWASQKEMMIDDIRKTEYENQRLHVSNSILDNALSTLKHETMYYPSQISQLIINKHVDFNETYEIINYYRQLYATFCMQLNRHILPLKSMCRPLDLRQILNKSHFDLKTDSPDTRIPADPDMLGYLFEILRSIVHQEVLNVYIHDRDKHYTEIIIKLNGYLIMEEEVNVLFTPLTKDLRFLIIKQIIRDHGECTNARGCGILAVYNHADQTTDLKITLAKTTH